MENAQGPIMQEKPPSQFENLLRRLDGDRDRAGQKYEELRRRLIRFFGWNNCFPAEDLADDTLDRVALRSENDEIHDIVRFSWGVARNVMREFHKRQPSIAIDDLPPREVPRSGNAELAIIHAIERRRRLQCLHQCIQRLAADERELFLEYEYYTDRPQNTVKLAARLGLTVGALQTKAHRIKHRVETCARKCLASRGKLVSAFSKAMSRDEQ
jgi:DNA-directed RNA polymerase specialized sigma24 family protein